MARPENLYEELIALNSEDSLNKTASVKDAEQVRKELDDIGYSSEQLETLANEIFGFVKKAEEVANPDQQQEEPQQTVEDTATEENVEGQAPENPDMEPNEEVRDQAISTIENSIGTLENAVETLKAVETEENAENVDQMAQALDNTKQAFEMFGFIKIAEEVTPVEVAEEDAPEAQAEAMDTVEEKIVELAQAVDELKETTEEDTTGAEESVIELAAAYQEYKMSKIAEAEEAEEETMSAEDIDAALDNATEEEVENIISDAYDKASEILEENGVTLTDYIEAKVEDPEVAEEVADTVAKLAAISGKNMLKVADDVIGATMHKLASY